MKVRIIISLLALEALFGSLYIIYPQNLTIDTLALMSTFLLMWGLYDSSQSQHTLWVNYPIIGRLRWLAEDLRPKISQYFVESDTNGTPINRENRSIVYQRAKKDIDTVPFGTQHNVYENGYEFLAHSVFPVSTEHINFKEDPKLCFGSKSKIKYQSSLFNVSGMSYGALSANAIRAINKGAQLGGFSQNTGEGGISEYHEQGGDIIYQFSSSYNGCGKTNKDGIRVFDDEMFRVSASHPQVKMVELKLSQGAKPAHGGILPASKNTPEIAKIRGLEESGVEVISPSAHSAFSDFKSMLAFIDRLRTLCDKPIGIKLCVGSVSEIEDMISLFAKEDNYPDFITIDGGEGGTGGAPLEFTNSVGMPLVDGLVLVNKTLIKYKLRDKIRISASGKVITAFDVVKLISLGADTVNAARAFLLSLGCIQARVCNLNKCPTDIAIQKAHHLNGLDPDLKSVRVFNYQNKTLETVKDLMGAIGVTQTKDITPDKIFKRIDINKVQSFKELYYN